MATPEKPSQPTEQNSQSLLNQLRIAREGMGYAVLNDYCDLITARFDEALQAKGIVYLQARRRVKNTSSEIETKIEKSKNTVKDYEDKMDEIYMLGNRFFTTFIFEQIEETGRQSEADGTEFMSKATEKLYAILEEE